MKQDSRRPDGSRCCITGKSGTLWDPLPVLPILAVPAGWVDNKVGDMGPYHGSDTARVEILSCLGPAPGLPQPSVSGLVALVCKRTRKSATALQPLARPQVGREGICERLREVGKAAAFDRGEWRERVRKPLSSVHFLADASSNDGGEQYQVMLVQVGPEEPLEVDGHYPLLGDRSRSADRAVRGRGRLQPVGAGLGRAAAVTGACLRTRTSTPGTSWPTGRPGRARGAPAAGGGCRASSTPSTGTTPRLCLRGSGGIGGIWT